MEREVGLLGGGALAEHLTQCPACVFDGPYLLIGAVARRQLGGQLFQRHAQFHHLQHFVQAVLAGEFGDPLRRAALNVGAGTLAAR